MEKENLTNEKLRNKFANQFELVSYAIRLADNMIKTGRTPRVQIGSQNACLNVLAEIAQGKDVLEELLDEDDDLMSDEEIAALFIEKPDSTERKKNRLL